jgi:hypothetical protein
MTANNIGRSPGAGDRTHSLVWLAPVVYMFLIGVYFLARYSGAWAESDSSALTQIITAFHDQGQLVPDSIHVYANGYSYQAISTFLVFATGLDVATLQRLVYPLLACLVVLPALLLYRELTGRMSGAIIGAFLLFTQPEFLFVVMRSSHEKFTRALMLFCLFLLVRSIKVSDQRNVFAVYVSLFYVAIFALVASNSFIAHSFIFALGMALLLGWVLHSRNRVMLGTGVTALTRLPYVIGTSFAVVYLFIFYVYPPAVHQLSVYENIWEQLAALLLNTDVSTPTNAYSVVISGWTSMNVYLIVSIANWIVLGASFFVWAYQGIQWFWNKRPYGTQSSLIIWLLYAAFAGQGFLSVLIDLSGALSSNAQQRLFPSIAVFAVAILVNAYVNWQPRNFVRPLRLAMASLVFFVAIMSVFKATNEPLVSNVWMFYKPQEIAAVDWSEANLENSEVWTEFDERLVVAYHTLRQESAAGNAYYGGPRSVTTQTVITSDISRLRSSRLNRELPVLPDANRIYDNGEAEIYRLRPVSPHQR